MGSGGHDSDVILTNGDLGLLDRLSKQLIQLLLPLRLQLLLRLRAVRHRSATAQWNPLANLPQGGLPVRLLLRH